MFINVYTCTLVYMYQYIYVKHFLINNKGIYCTGKPCLVQNLNLVVLEKFSTNAVFKEYFKTVLKLVSSIYLQQV